MMLLLVKLIGKLYLMLLGYSARLKIVNKEYALPFLENGCNAIYAFWHSRIIFLVAYGVYRLKKPRISVIISNSRDGEYIARIAESVGISPVRGSSSKGASTAFSKFLELGKNGYDLAITPDGPRGPREVVKPGVIELARKSGLSIIPVSYSSRWKKIFKSWDRFLLPFPLSKVVVVFGRPIQVRSDADDTEKKSLELLLGDILTGITRQADEMVRG